MNKRYYWLKLKQDFFKSLPMKKLRRIAGGDTYTIIYLKLQLLSIKDEGLLYYQGFENSFQEEMALALDEDVENIRTTLMYLESVGLLKQQNETTYILTEVPFLIGSEGASAQRMRKHRQQMALEDKQKEAKASLRDTHVTKSDTEIEKEIEKEIEIDKEIDKEIEIESKSINYQKVVDMYNDTCVSLPKVQSLSDARRKAIRARLKVYQLSDIQRAFEKAENSNFLKGANGRDWNANFDWLMKDANIAKVLDGNYDNFESKKVPPLVSSNKGNKVAQELDESYRMMQEWAAEREV